MGASQIKRSAVAAGCPSFGGGQKKTKKVTQKPSKHDQSPWHRATTRTNSVCACLIALTDLGQPGLLNWPGGTSELQDSPVFSSVFDSVSHSCFSMCFSTWPDCDGVCSQILFHRDVVGTALVVRRRGQRAGKSCRQVEKQLNKN